MVQAANLVETPAYDGLFRRIQAQVNEKVKIPVEIALGDDCSYHFGDGEPVVKVLVNDPAGLSALGRLDELRICEAYMNV